MIKVLIGLSDQQLISNIALQITVSAKMCQLSVYHLRIVLFLVTSNSCSYAFAVRILHDQLRRRYYLALLRAMLVTTSATLLLVQVAFAINSELIRADDVAQLALPAMCKPVSRDPYRGLINFTNMVMLPLVFSTNTIWILVPSLFLSNIVAATARIGKGLLNYGVLARLWYSPALDTTLHISGLYFSAYLVWLSTVYIWQLARIAQALGGSKLPDFVEDARESDWGFGQILPLVLLLLPILNAIQTFAGKSL